MDTIRIGSRSSALALWQANFIADLLTSLSVPSEIIEIESFGDKVTDIPIHKLGDKGVFTKALDEALLNDDIDIAVHSLKDVPTELPDGLKLLAVPERAMAADVLVEPLDSQNEHRGPRTIATGSIRRKAFWLNRYPEDKTENIRGNVPTRLKKLDNSEWHGAIFAEAGLSRLALHNRISERLDWMIPAPAQGALGVICRDENMPKEIKNLLNHPPSRVSVELERAFLNTLEAGCSSPVGAYAQQVQNKILFKGAVLSHDGSQRLNVEEELLLSDVKPNISRKWAEDLLKAGAQNLIQSSDSQ